ncbi:MAG TPA: YHS domain-containing (seleno)protein [Caulobacteraceae bacterium]|nr:YHS domain-containing (seleno)protein [Caulobacteraceae bacterium]
MTIGTLTVRGLFLAAAVVSTPLAAPAVAMAASAEIFTPAFSHVALGGYDAVSYFDGKPVKGAPAFRTEWKGAEFRFASAEHLTKFRANPAAYAPQYGGYCAWAVAEGHLASGDPLAWRVVNGRLYLNYNAAVQRQWAKDVPANIARGDRNWPRVLR